MFVVYDVVGGDDDVDGGDGGDLIVFNVVEGRQLNLVIDFLFSFFPPFSMENEKMYRKLEDEDEDDDGVKNRSKLNGYNFLFFQLNYKNSVYCHR